MVLELGPWGRVLSVATAACIVLVVLVVVVCFVGPGCWGYECLNAADTERERRRRQAHSKTSGLSVSTMAPSSGEMLKPLPLRRPTSSVETGSFISLLGRMDAHRDSTYSSMSEATERSSFRSVTTVESADSSMSLDGTTSSSTASASASTSAPATSSAATPAAQPEKQEPPQIDIAMQFIPAGDGSAGQLQVTVKGANRLPGRGYVGGVEPFVEVSVVRCTWPLHRRAGPPVHIVRTQSLRHTHNPRFQQTFPLDARRSDLKEWSLRATAFDRDRYGNPTELSFVDVSLRDLKGLSAGHHLDLTFPMQISNKENGELLLGLSYLPTAQRLSVSIMRGARLKYLEVADSLAEFCPFVRVIQLNCSNGRSVKRMKTSRRPGSDAPEFSETLMFNLSSSQIETAVFLVLLMSRVRRHEEHSDGQSSSSEKDRAEERCLGKAAVGLYVGSQRGRHHWRTVLESPRTMHFAWHSLK